ncbi:hypothetical protein ACJMK2_020400 [Sinanodonta woodiana]|uniref:Uncharacterized protein n=1 Tax=Sinanodonta woodiana TaxID=1069815 RepID=A0ABD3TYZ3_SINWO
MASTSWVFGVLGKSGDYFAVMGVLFASYFGLKVALTFILFLRSFAHGGLASLVNRPGTWAESKYKVKTMIIQADFTHGTDIYPNIQTKLQGLDISVLVNNVGLSYDYPEFFLQITDREKKCMDLIHVNVTSVAMMTSIVLPGMVERRHGVVLNISSASGKRPIPLLTVYSACKAFVSFFSDCLKTEYGSSGITIQCVMPFFVATNMTKVRKTRFFVPSASTYVQSALKTVGLEQETYGYFPHKLMGFAMEWLPKWLVLLYGMKGLLTASAKAKRRQQEKKEY